MSMRTLVGAVIFSLVLALAVFAAEANAAGAVVAACCG
jgi:hypothetical protein